MVFDLWFCTRVFRHFEGAPFFRSHSKIKMSVKNSGTRVAWSLKKESASLIIENFKEAMDHFDEENVISSEVFLVCNFSMFFLNLRIVIPTS